ncbi:hypothetical protein ACVIQY_006254 [Bradyrhizobium sp. USDA 3051]
MARDYFDVLIVGAGCPASARVIIFRPNARVRATSSSGSATASSCCKAIREQRASVATKEMDTFRHDGIRVKDGSVLAAPWYPPKGGHPIKLC